MNNKKALFITNIDIYDPNGNGGVKASQRNLQLIKAHFGVENTVIGFASRKNHSSLPKDAVVFRCPNSSLEQLIAALFGCKTYFPWDERKLIKFIKESDSDLLFIDSSLNGRIARLAKKIPIKTVVFYHNIEADYSWNKVKNEGFYFFPSYWASKYNDRCGTMADVVMCLNTRDSNRLMTLYHRKADFLLPVTFTDCFDVKKTTNQYKREILFLGSLFPPNQISIEWFIQDVMPKLDNIHLNIVGKDFETKRDEYEKKGDISVIGSVQELDPWYYNHCAVVMPIKYGAGMKVKTAEAMMYGRRIFASDEALAGYLVDGVSGITRCNTASEFADALNRYFSDGKFRTYEPEVRELFLKEYETGVVHAKFDKLLDELLGK